MFGATGLYGYTTRRDLSATGSFLNMSLIGMLIASIVNNFMSSALQFVVSVVGIIVSAGLTAWDTQSIEGNTPRVSILNRGRSWPCTARSLSTSI